MKFSESYFQDVKSQMAELSREEVVMGEISTTIQELRETINIKAKGYGNLYSLLIYETYRYV